MITCTTAGQLSPADRIALLGRAKSGDLDARNRLVMSVWPLVKRLAVRFAAKVPTRRAGHTVADLAAEAFAYILGRITNPVGGWQPGRGDLSTWAGYECRTAFRRAAGLSNGCRRMLSPVAAAGSLAHSADAGPAARDDDPAEAAAAKIDAADVLARASTADRELLRMRFAAGLSYPEIADALGIQEATARRRTDAAVARAKAAAAGASHWWWSPAEVAAMLRMRADGFTLAAIGERLGLSRHSVRRAIAKAAAAAS